MVEFRTGRIEFPGRKGFGPQTDDRTESFPSPVRERTFAVILTGYELKFDGDDHHIHRAIIDVQGSLVDPTTIEVTCTLGLRDDSGDWNDTYSGYVAYAVIADLEP